MTEKVAVSHAKQPLVFFLFVVCGNGTADGKSVILKELLALRVVKSRDIAGDADHAVAQLDVGGL